MEHELYNKTDKQLLKVGKVELLAYIRELEGAINNQGDSNVVEDTNKDTNTGLVQDTKHLTAYTFSDTVTKKDMYSF